MAWQTKLNGDSLSWLLEPDPANPAIRYFALTDLLNRPATDPDVLSAKAAMMENGPLPVILAAQHPEGYWQKPGSGYGKYRSTVWQIMLLAELGADPIDDRVRRGCEYVLTHTLAPNGGFACNQKATASGVIHCLNGNLVAALIKLGYLNDPRVQGAIDWQAHAITGVAPIVYYQSATSGPNFSCAANDKLPCGWGAVKALRALSAVPPDQRTPLITQAIEQSAQFLLSHDPVVADYPNNGAISSAWFKLGFPVSYWADVLETLTLLVALGYANDPRLAAAFDWVLAKQDAQGRWKMQNTLNGKMWVDIEKRGQPSKWVTLRALRLLKALGVGVRL